MKSYLELVRKVVETGEAKNDTLSLFGEKLEFDLQQGFPLITTRTINFKAVKGELASFLKGFTDIRSFHQFGVKFWDADCNKESWSNNPNKKHEFDLGNIYGYQWRKGFGFDQLVKVVNDLKFNFNSRRQLLMTFNPADLDKGCLPPCYVSHQFYVRNGNTLDMMVHQRSADLMIGVPFDIASYALFQHLLAKEANFYVGKLIVNFGDVHIYNSHFPVVAEQLQRVPRKLPTLELDEHTNIFDFYPHNARVIGYSPVGPLKYKFETQKL